MAGIDSLNIKFSGVSEMLAEFDKLGTEVLKDVKERLVQGADELLRKANAEVPLDKSTLLKSGGVDTDRVESSLEVDVGFSTPYAIRLHEHPEYNFKNGRKGKYLEDPVHQNQDLLEKHIGEGLQKLIG